MRWGLVGFNQIAGYAQQSGWTRPNLTSFSCRNFFTFCRCWRGWKEVSARHSRCSLKTVNKKSAWCRGDLNQHSPALQAHALTTILGMLLCQSSGSLVDWFCKSDGCISWQFAIVRSALSKPTIWVSVWRFFIHSVCCIRDTAKWPLDMSHDFSNILPTSVPYCLHLSLIYPTNLPRLSPNAYWFFHDLVHTVPRPMLIFV